jgi:O-antigen/teichoic acid export membrane protein
VLTSYAEAILLAFEHAEDFVLVYLGENVLRAIVSCVLVLSGYGIVALTIVVLGVRCIAAVAMLVALERRGARVLARPDAAICKHLVRQMPVVSAIPVVTAVYWRSDVLLLSWFAGMTEVGYYSAATRLLDIMRSVPQGYGRAVYPILARLHGDRPAEFRSVARQSVRGVTVLMTAGALLLWGLSDRLVALMYGPGFAVAGRALGILAWSGVPFALTIVLAHVLFAGHRQAADLGTNVLATVASVLANLIVIPRWGCIGAAWTALGSMALHAQLQYLAMRGMVRLDVGAPLVRIGVAAGAAAAVFMVAGDMPIVAKAAAGMAAYVATLLVAGAVRGEDATAVRQAMRDAIPAWRGAGK